MKLKVLAPFRGRLSGEAYWATDSIVEVVDEVAATLLTTWPLKFELVEEEVKEIVTTVEVIVPVEPKRRGRPPKVRG